MSEFPPSQHRSSQRRSFQQHEEQHSAEFSSTEFSSTEFSSTEPHSAAEPSASHHADPAEQLITYEGLPESAGGAHGMRGKDPLVADERIAEFLASCFRIDAASELLLVLDGKTQASAQDTAAIASAASGRFGAPRDTGGHATEWLLSEDTQARADALKLVAAAGKAGHPGLALVQSWKGRVLDQHTKRPYPGISAEDFGNYRVDNEGKLLGESRVRATIGSHRSTVSLWLNLPADQRLEPAVGFITAHLPVLLSPHHWRRWQPAYTGSDYRFFKEPSPLAER